MNSIIENLEYFFILQIKKLSRVAVFEKKIYIHMWQVFLEMIVYPNIIYNQIQMEKLKINSLITFYFLKNIFLNNTA